MQRVAFHLGGHACQIDLEARCRDALTERPQRRLASSSVVGDQRVRARFWQRRQGAYGSRVVPLLDWRGCDRAHGDEQASAALAASLQPIAPRNAEHDFE